MANQKGPFRNRAAGGKPVDKHFETSDGHSGSPTRVKNKKVSYTDDRDSYESDRDDYRSGSTEQRRPPRRDSHDDADGRYGQGKQSNRRDPPHRSTNGRGGKYEEEVLSDDGYDDDYSNGRSSPPRQKRSLSDRSHDRGRGSRREDEYVTRAEYDDLALMYEDLQLEHRALKEEMTVQNELINVRTIHAVILDHLLIYLHLNSAGTEIADEISAAGRSSRRCSSPGASPTR